MSKDRPAGMDDLSGIKSQPLPTQKTPSCGCNMGTVAKIAGGPVDSGSGKEIVNFGKGAKA